MAYQKSMLCVGGPRAGQRYSVLYGAGFRVPIKSDMTEPNKRFADYREETFHTPQCDVSFWTPEGQTSMETIEKLLQAYEQLFRMSSDMHGSTAPREPRHDPVAD